MLHPDGKNHTQCCATRGVPEVCHAFCYGIVEELDNEHLTCLVHFDVIGECMQEGRGMCSLFKVSCMKGAAWSLVDVIAAFVSCY